jgi:Uma2 family endonuclease
METIDIEEEEEKVEIVRIPMSEARFLKWNPEDGFLYEFDNGFAESTHPAKQEETYIFANMADKFMQTNAFQQRGRLFAETRCWTSETQMRIPDVSFYTQTQIQSMAQKIKTVPSFVVEMISESDQAYRIEKKLREYFAAGVKTVWHIFPLLRMVRTFTSIKNEQTFTDNEEVFNAAPAVPDLQMSVEELFRV